MLQIPYHSVSKPQEWHKGVLWCNLKVRGRTAHGSSPELGINSIYKSIQIIDILKQHNFPFKHKYLKKSSLNVGKFISGENINSVPDEASIYIDIRTVNQNSLYLKSLMKKIGKKCTINSIVSQEKVYNDKWKKVSNINLLKYICKLQNKIFTPKCANYFTDVAPLQKIYNKPFTVILGPGYPKLAHQTNEYISIRNLETSKNIYKEIVKYYC